MATRRSSPTARPWPKKAAKRSGRVEGTEVRRTILQRWDFFALFVLVASAFGIAASAQGDGSIDGVHHLATQQAAGTLRLLVAGQLQQTFSAADLKAMPHQTVTFHNIHTMADETYSGVPLSQLLSSYGVPTGDKLRGKTMSDYIVATGNDGYKAVLALAETDPAFHPGDVIVADAMDGNPLDAKEGPFKLVVTEDKRPARSVHNLVSIEVRKAD